MIALPDTNLRPDLDTAQVIAEERESAGLALVQALCQALDDAEVRYCHWKSNHELERSVNGDSDLDLLIATDHTPRFTQVLYRLGFKQLHSAVQHAMPGVLDYFGLDEKTGKLVHVHAHYKLVIGDDVTFNYHLPIEHCYFLSTSKRNGLPIPRAEIEFIVFVVRKALRHSSWDAILSGKGPLSSRERDGLSDLESRIELVAVKELLSRHLPFIDYSLLRDCYHNLRPGSSTWSRIASTRRLHAVLDAHTRRGRSADLELKIYRRLIRAYQRRMRSGGLPKRRLATGGVMIAFVGGDGAGKTTAVNSVHQWLAKDFDVRLLHMGKPKWSRVSRIVRAILKIGRQVGWYPYIAAIDLLCSDRENAANVRGFYPAIIRELCTARDRYLQYRKGRQFVNNGGIVICDRFPLSEIKLMEGPIIVQLTAPSGASGFARYLSRLEGSYYERMSIPELLFMLKIEPALAVRRRPEEDEFFVRVRTSEIWNMHQTPDNCFVLDASRSQAELLSKLKTIIWSAI